MLRRLMRSKIHRATVTDANQHYVGSISIDENLMKRADIREFEQVHVLDVDNGARLVTYAIAGSVGEICINGAAAHLVHVGDRVIIIAYAEYASEEVEGHQATVVHVDEQNRERTSE